MTDYLKTTEENQLHLCGVAKDCILLAQGDDEKANKLLKQAIWDSEEFKTLPKFRQGFVVGFVAGLQANAMSATLELPDIGKQVPEKEEPPRGIKNMQPGVTWHRHPNGGGWVSETAYVEGTAMVGVKAVVFENARVYERAKIYGSAKVRGDAECYGACHIHGLATVTERAKVFDAARVLGKVILCGDVEVGGQSLVRGDSVIDKGLLLDERHAPDQIKKSYTRELKHSSTATKAVTRRKAEGS